MAGNSQLTKARQIVADGIPFGPRLHPCVCGAGRHAHGGSAGTGACKATDCRRYRADLAWDLAYAAYDAEQLSLGQALRKADKILGQKRRAANPVLEGQWRIGVSDTDTCPRSLWYRNMPPEDFTPAWEDKREAMVGTMIHEGAEERLKLVFPWRLYEYEIAVPGLDRKSRIDWYDPVIQQLGDVKSAGDWRWDQVGQDGPEERTWWKVQVYALAMEEAGYPVKTVRLDYLKRANGHDETFVVDYDRAEAEKALDVLLAHAENFDLLADGLATDDMLDDLFPRTGTGPASDALCRRCFARNHCWSIVEAEAAGRSPESYTVLGPDPDAEVITFHIAEKVEATKERLAAQKREDQAKTLMQGVEPGRYGEYEGYEKWGGGGDDKSRYADTLADLFSLPEGQRPALDDIPMPQKRRYSYIAWGKVRKSVLQAEEKARKATAKAAAEAEARAEAAAPPLRDDEPEQTEHTERGVA